MFHSGSRNTKNKNWSLYTVYRNKYSIKYTDETKKVLLVYISPKELDVKELSREVLGNTPSAFVKIFMREC